MAKTITVTNLKGGCGKTTTALNLSAYLGLAGKRVLAVDADQWSHLTGGFGIDKNKLKITLSDVLTESIDINEAIVSTEFECVSCLPSNNNIVAQNVFFGKGNYLSDEMVLKEKLETIQRDYDYIIIDCSTGLSSVALSAIYAADSLIIPLQCEYFALEALSDMMQVIKVMKERVVPDLYVEGVLFTMYRPTRLGNDVIMDVRNKIKYNIYNTVIPRNIDLAASSGSGKPIAYCAPKSSGARAYREFAAEFIQRSN